MKLEPTLHKALLAGVTRAPISPQAAASPALHALLANVPDAARLWHTVAAADLWQRAGFQPRQGALPNAAACIDDVPCPRAAEQVLQLILRGIHAELLESWLSQAQALEFSLPHSALVPLLDLATQKPALRPAVGSLLGKRGQWLVAQHPAWTKVFGIQSADGKALNTWELGSLEQRVNALQGMRRSNAHSALAALESEWQQEPVENRIALLPCLSIGLSLDDEAFLERALDDKRKEVRTIAQNLLGTLPGSQLGERCKARLLALFTFERRAAGPKLALQLPETCDKPMKRDGIGNQTYHATGEKAGWILDLMRSVPPMVWSTTWELTPRQVIDLLSAQEFRIALLTGLVQATARAVGHATGAAAIDWFVALIDVDRARGGINTATMLLPDLVRLPLADQERVVKRWLIQSAITPHAFPYAIDWAGQRAAHAGALSPQLSRMLLSHVQREMLAMPQHDYSSRGTFKVLERVLDADDPSYAMSNWPAENWEHWPTWRALADDLMETMNFRHTMQASFLENDA